MRDCARETIELVRGRTRGDLDTDRVFALAIVRLLEIIGEAARRVPPDEQARIAGIPWESIVGLRNRLIHGKVAFPLDSRIAPTGLQRSSANGSR